MKFSGDRLQNFEIRVGNDGQEIGNNTICYKQLNPMEPGVTRNFTCSPKIFGSWISINKSHTVPDLAMLQLREIRVYDGKDTLA